MKISTWRSYVLGGLLILFGGIIISKLFSLQVLNHGFYKAMAAGQQNISSVGSGLRGEIFAQDKHGNLYLLATTQEVPYAFASLPEIGDARVAAEQLSLILNLDFATVLSRLEGGTNLHAILKRELTVEENSALREAQLPGIYVRYDIRRFYPHGSLASHVLGFVNQDGKGQYGVEEYYNDTLQGKEGILTIARNPAAYLVSLFQDTVQDGSDILLTLDFNIQSAAESILQATAARVKAEEGTVIVLEPSTGKILALANIPSFDPNIYGKAEGLGVFQNAATQKTYEPGSVFKSITLGAALDAGVIHPDTEYTDTGFRNIGGRTIRNYDQRVYGKQTMTDVLKFSINTGVVYAEELLGHQPFLTYLTNFELFRPTRVDLAGETYSENRTFKQGYDVNFATASFGQGIEMTSLQLMRAYTALIGGGRMVRPFVADTILSSKGETRKTEVEYSNLILSSKAASQITSMMALVTEEGFSKGARVQGYYVGGKTGTAQVAWSALGVSRAGYSDKTIQSFIGFAPAFQPRFLILVKLDNPATRSAEASATPIFQELAQYLVNYYEIPPERE
ncbi:MAG: penicillin-binding protein 2 [Candidatus Yanofskybacteria bacterium]|nr:penicillin-binding protein 2 [Candidatus Yanofskybacteria bacterium]